MSYYLFSPIGSSDPIRKGRDGAFIHICRNYKPVKIILFMSHEILGCHRKDNRYLASVELLKKERGFENWNPDIEIIEREDLIDVQKMDEFFDDFKESIEQLKALCADGDTVLLNISSGTPAMKYTLQLLSTADREKLKPIQVVTPVRASNKDISEYLVEEEWICNDDNNPDRFKNRSGISKNDNLFAYLLKENIIALIKNYDYAGALTVSELIADDLGEDFIALLTAAKERLALNYQSANLCFKNYSFKLLFNETGGVSKIFEYILWLDIKIKTKNYIEFTRGITPVFEDLLYSFVEDKIGRYVNKDSKWIVKELKSSDDFSGMSFAEKLSDKYPTAYVRSEELIEIIEHFFSSDTKLIDAIKEIRSFESATRNNVAHEIKPLDESEVESCSRIFDKLLFLMIKKGMIKNESKSDFLKSYDSMNDFIIRKIK